MKNKNSLNKGKTIEEIYGVKRADEIREAMKKGQRLVKYNSEEMSRRAKIGIKICRKNKIGFFSKEAREKAVKTNIKNKTGVFGLSQERRRDAAIKGIEMQKKNSIGIHSCEGRKAANKKAAETNRKNKTGMFHDKKIQSAAGKIGGAIAGPKSVLTNRKNKLIAYKGIFFASKGEKEIAINLLKQNFVKKLAPACHFKIERKEIDFYLEKRKTFIEYHPFDRSGRSSEEYFSDRRALLNKNGYKDHNLVVIR